MDYSLALELKQAGFPQERQKVHADIEGVQATVSDVKLPTLSELIHACGKKIKSLHRFEKGEVFQGMECDVDGWQAEGKDHWYMGESPEEAVAYFWLAINRK